MIIRLSSGRTRAASWKRQMEAKETLLRNSNKMMIRCSPYVEKNAFLLLLLPSSVALGRSACRSPPPCRCHPCSRADSWRKRTKLRDICYLVARLVIDEKKEKRERKSVKASKKRNLCEEKFAELNEKRVKARKDIVAKHI
ncbi:hypothetical protein P5V15_008527 [Pogonomyrmex californicus]